MAIKKTNVEIAKLFIGELSLHTLEILFLYEETDQKEDFFEDMIVNMPDAAEMLLDKFHENNVKKRKFEFPMLLIQFLKFINKRFREESVFNYLGHVTIELYCNSYYAYRTKIVQFVPLFLSLIHVILLSCYLILEKDFQYDTSMFRHSLFSYCLFLIFIEIFQFIYFGSKYLSSFGNIIDFTALISSAVLTSPSDLEYRKRLQSGCVSIIFSYVSLGYFFLLVPKIGGYASAVVTVTEKTIKILLVTIVYFLGFSIAFHVLSNSDEMNYKWLWFLRVGFFLIADFGFNDFAKGFDYEIKYFIMVLALIVFPIVINTVLIVFSIDKEEAVTEIFKDIKIKTLESGLRNTPAPFTRSKRKSRNKIFEWFYTSDDGILNSFNEKNSVLYNWRQERASQKK